MAASRGAPARTEVTQAREDASKTKVGLYMVSRLVIIPKLRMSRGTSRPATRRPPGTHRLPRSRRLVLVAAAILGAGVLFAAPALATTGPPVIKSMSASAGGENVASVNIDPEGLETTYEIWLECSSCDPSDQRAAGSLPAVEEVRSVTLVLSGLQPGHYYWFAVLARNAAGEASQRSDILDASSSPGPFPNGASPVGIILSPTTGAASGQLLAIAEREQDEKLAKEQEAQKAEEHVRLVAEAAEREYREAAEAAAAVLRQRARACVVPLLRGDTLAAAGRALANAHCRLGKVSRSRRHHETILVTRQDPRPGETLPVGGRVTLTLGARQASRR